MAQAVLLSDLRFFMLLIKQICYVRRTNSLTQLQQACWLPYSRTKIYAARMSRGAAAAIDRYVLPAPVFSSKPAGRRCCCRSTGQTDVRTLDAYRILATCMDSLQPELRMLNCTVCTFAAKLKTFLFSAVGASENF